MELSVDNIEVEINEMIDKLIFALNERRKHLLECLKIKRGKMRPIHRDDEIGETLIETRENLNAQKFPNMLQSMYKRMINEVDNKISDYLQPPQEIKFNRNTRDLETQIATLGEITLHELPILPPIPQRAATPDVSSKPDIDSPAPVRRTNSPFRSPIPSPRHQRNLSKSHPRGDPKQYLWGRMSREDCETLLLKRAKNGEFIFRESPNREGELVLSMKYHHRIHHFNIKQEDGWFCVGENFRVRFLPEIISHYEKIPIASYREKISGKLIDVFLSQALAKEEEK